MYAGLLNAQGSGMKAVSPDDRVVTGTEAFLWKEFDAEETRPENVDFGPLPADIKAKLEYETDRKTFRFGGFGGRWGVRLTPDLDLCACIAFYRFGGLQML